MKHLWWLAIVCLLCQNVCRSTKVGEQEQFMLVAGPLTKQPPPSSDGAAKNVFDCSHPAPLGSRHYFRSLQSRGVTHFKVPLPWAQILPTGLPSQPQQSVVACYQKLLKELLGAGLQPLVILHGSSIPDGLRSRSGGWESQELLSKFQQYAEFAFHEFGALARSWVTLSELDHLPHVGQHADGPSPLQNVLKLNRNIYRIFHEKFPDGGKKKRDYFGSSKHLWYSQILKHFTA